MIDNRFSIGGQFWNDNNIYQSDFRKEENVKYIFDGASSTIRFIIKLLKDKNINNILLPSYLCPTIKRNFEKNAMGIEYYKVNLDFSINVDDLKKKIENSDIKVIYIINYFGLAYKEDEIKFLESLKQQQILIVEDRVQALSSEYEEDLIGDFTFDSLRKFAGVDGSRLFTAKEINFDKEEFKVNYNYINLIARARKNKRMFVDKIIHSEEDFLRYFDEAEREYQDENEICVLPQEELQRFKKLNLNYISTKRKENFLYLYNKLKKIDGIKIITTETICNKFIPFGLIIFIENRDYIRKKLFKNRIFCPVLWDLRNEEFIRNFDDSRYASEHILMIPIDQRYNISDYRQLILFFETMI